MSTLGRRCLPAPLSTPTSSRLYCICSPPTCSTKISMVFVLLVALQLPLANFASAAEAAVASCFTPRLAQTLVACNPSIVGGWRKQSVVVLDGVLGREVSK